MHIVYFYIRLYSFYGPCGPEIKLYYIIIIIITRSSLLSNLVKGLSCPECRAASLIVCVPDHQLVSESLIIQLKITPSASSVYDNNMNSRFGGR